MTATNHALTGALIGFSVVNPILAIPLAFISHFVLDAITHIGVTSDHNKWMRSKTFKTMLIIDATLCLALVVTLRVGHPINWFLAAICAFVAASPDLLSVNHFYLVNHHKTSSANVYSRFATKIQWFERPSGTIVEAVWLASMLIALRIFI